ncbi:MAG: carbohydrate ABC transporter permease, partial [Christensenella sp.]|nr:carbohydrate ABC transporter permease [Christensenella sp.]
MKISGREYIRIRNKGEWKYHLILIIALVIMIYPLLYMVGTSFKTLPEIFSSGLNVVPTNPTLDNYTKAFDSLPVLRFLLNSLIIAVIVTASKIFTSILASYALCFMDLKHASLIFNLFTISMFIPF